MNMDDQKHLSQLQRARILRAMVEILIERGFRATTVAAVVAEAGVSRRAFGRLFSDLEECFIAVLDEGWARVTELVCDALGQQETWQAGLRSAMASLLALLDREPALARVWLVESLAAGPRVLQHRERRMAELRSAISAVERWPGTEAGDLPPLGPEGAFSAVLGIVENHLLTRSSAPLLGKLGPLMGLAVAPYVDKAGASREIERGERLAAAIEAGERMLPLPPAEPEAAFDAELVEAFHHPKAHRARRCMLYLVEHPGLSNRQVGKAIGIAHKGQVSTLLARLEGMGLLHKQKGAPGHPNAWWPTEEGERIASVLVPAGTPGVHIQLTSPHLNVTS